MDIVINAQKEEIPPNNLPLKPLGSYWLNILFCINTKTDYLPLGELLRLYHGLEEGAWLVASPMHWQATHNDAMITAITDALDFTEHESHAWFEVTSQFLKDEGITVFYHDAYTWLLKANAKPVLQTPSIYAMPNHSMQPILKSMDASFYWQRLLTEAQMFFSAHPLNIDRINTFPINGLWFYGGGALNLDNTKSIFSDDPRLVTLFPEIKKWSNLEHQLEENAVLLINNEKYDSLDHLNKYPIQWFWNNTAYKTKKIRKWTQLWGYLKNANKTQRI